jgi:hypothetical protein
MSYQDELRKKAVAGNFSPGSYYRSTMRGAPGSYKPTAQANQAQGQYQSWLKKKPGAYKSKWQSQIDELLNGILNRGDFEYDVDTDPLYAQYKDKFTKEGRRAMQESMGGATGLTGGFGSTAGQAAGQQAYGNYMTGLTDKIPELEQAAYAKWQNDLANQYNQYGMLSGEEQTGYGRYRDTLGDWTDERQFRYGAWQDASNTGYNRWRDQYSMWQQDRDYWDQRAQREAAEAAARGGPGGPGGIRNPWGETYGDTADRASQEDAYANAADNWANWKGRNPGKTYADYQAYLDKKFKDSQHL